MKRIFSIICLLIASPPVFAVEWMEDFAAAKKAAVENHKDILIDFTGSDWCGYCMMLDAEVFQKDEFSKVVPHGFVLVKIDSPRDTARQSPALREQNTKLSGLYSVEGLPTVILADAEGRPYAATGYKEEFAKKPAGWVDHLMALRKVREERDQAFAGAAKTDGMDRARHLAAGLSRLDPAWFAGFYQKEVNLILAADTGDSLGMRKALGQLEDDRAFSSKLEALGMETDKFLVAKKTKEAIGLVDAWLARENPTGERRQMALSLKVDLVAELADDQATLKLIDEVIRLDPRSATAADLKELADSIRE